MKTKLVIACILSMIPFFVFSQVSEKIEISKDNSKVYLIKTEKEILSPTKSVITIDTTLTLNAIGDARYFVNISMITRLINNDSIYISKHTTPITSFFFAKSKITHKYLKKSNNNIVVNQSIPVMAYAKNDVLVALFGILTVLVLVVVFCFIDPTFFDFKWTIPVAFPMFLIGYIFIFNLRLVDIIFLLFIGILAQYILKKYVIALPIRKFKLRKDGWNTKSPLKVFKDGSMILHGKIRERIFVDKKYNILKHQPYNRIALYSANLEITQNSDGKFGLISKNDHEVILEAKHNVAFFTKNVAVIVNPGVSYYIFDIYTKEKIISKILTFDYFSVIHFSRDGKDIQIEIDDDGNLKSN